MTRKEVVPAEVTDLGLQLLRGRPIEDAKEASAMQGMRGSNVWLLFLHRAREV
jgi:hypothetical protein